MTLTREGTIPRLEKRSYEVATLPKRNELEEKVTKLRAWALDTNFAQFVSTEPYRTDSTDHRVFDGILGLILKRNIEPINVSARTVARESGVSHVTAARAIERLNGSLLDVKAVDSRFGSYEIRLGMYAEMNTYIIVSSRVHSASLYSNFRTDSAFLNGSSRYVREQASGESMDWIGETQQDWIKKYKLTPLKELGLRLIAILDNYPEGLTIQQIAELISRSERTIEVKVSQLLKFGLVRKSATKKVRRTIYILEKDWEFILAAKEDKLSTFRKAEEVESRRLESSILHNVGTLAQTQINGGNTKNLERRIDEMIQKWSQTQFKIERFNSQWEAYVWAQENLYRLPLQSHAISAFDTGFNMTQAADKLLAEVQERKN